MQPCVPHGRALTCSLARAAGRGDTEASGSDYDNCKETPICSPRVGPMSPTWCSYWIDIICLHCCWKKSQWIFPLKTDKKAKHDDLVQYFLTPWDRWIKQCGERAGITQGLGYGKQWRNYYNLHVYVCIWAMIGINSAYSFVMAILYEYMNHLANKTSREKNQPNSYY